MAFSLDAVNPFEAAYVFVFLVVFSLLAFVCQRKTWLWFGAIAAMFFGVISVVVPDQILKIQTSKEPDRMDVLMVRSHGISVIGASVPWLLLHDTRDATVHITLMMNHVVASSIEIMAQSFTFFLTGKTKTDTQASSVWSDQYLLLIMFPTIVWMLGSLIHLMRSHDFNTYPQHNIRLNQHLRIDAWLMLLLAIIALAFPRQLLNLTLPGMSTSEVMLHQMRSIGALMIGDAITSLQAPGFLHSRDKRALFTARLFSGVLNGGLYLAGVFLFNVTTNMAYHGPIVLLLLINALVARFTDGTTIYVVPTTSKFKGISAAKHD